MSRPLILTSTAAAAAAGNTPPPAGAAPRVDFIEIANAPGGFLSYPPPGGGLAARLEEKTASDWRQAWAAARSDADVYLSLSEKVGLPLALLGRKRRPHVLLAHHLTSARKRAFQRRTGYLRRFDRVIVLCRTQEAYLREEVGLAPDRVRFVYDKVDHRFWSPPDGGADGGYILSVGRERRDYETLMEAVRPLSVPTVIVASSPWSRQGDGHDGDIPSNVTLRRGLSYPDLRALYAGARLVVVPLEAGCDYAAGVNAVLEAQAMRKPLIVTHTPGIADYVEDGRTARVVPAGDPAALRAGITGLLGDEAERARLAASARRVVEDGRNLDTYVQAVTGIVCEAARR